MTVPADTEFKRLAGQLRQWDDHQLNRAAHEFKTRRERPSSGHPSRWLWAPVMALTSVLLIWALRVPDTLEPMSLAEGPAREVLTMADGSQVSLYEGTQAAIDEQKPEQVRIRLGLGRAKFDVKHRPERTLTVVAGSFQIVDLGTVFTVDRNTDHISVAVLEGAVQVSGPGLERALHAGQSEIFPTNGEAEAEIQPSAPTEEDEAPAPSAETTGRSKPPTGSGTQSTKPRGPEWARLAREGRYTEAWELLAKIGDGVSNRPAELLLAADTARLTGHPSAAVRTLKRFVSAFPGDPRAPSAAFTMGSLLLRNLGQPSRASAAFATTARLAPGGNLAEEARAKRVEALLRSGQKKRARQALRDYEARHPAGSHLESFRRRLAGEP